MHFVSRQTLPRVAALVAFLSVASPAVQAQSPLQTRSVEKIADGVYGVIYSEMKRNPVQANSLIIIGDDGVCVVDAHYTPSAARQTIAEIRKLTRLPVRYVVTTHWHDDHVFGNQEYKKAFPGVHFVAQTDTRDKMMSQLVGHRDGLVKAYSDGVTRARTRVKTGLDSQGNAIAPAYRAELAQLLPILDAYAKDFRSVEVTIPDLTFEKSLTLHLGTREVRVLSLGTGNTKGDAVIFLPKEKIAAVGDLVVHPVPYIYGGYPASWVNVLDSLRSLGLTAVVPGHGPVMRDFVYVDMVADVMRALSKQAKDAVSRGLTLEQFRAGLDLADLRKRFVGGVPEREGMFQASIVVAGSLAAYEEASGKEQAPSSSS